MIQKIQIEGSNSVSYEAKVLLIAISNIIRKSNNLEEVHKAVEEMANAEGIVLQPLNAEKENNSKA
jgi:hypothetical protein